MKKFGKKVLLYIGVAIFVFLASTVLMTYINERRFGFNPHYISTGQPFIWTFIIVLLFFAFDMFKLIDGKGGKKAKKAVDSVKDEKGNETKEFFSKDFVTEQELKTNKGFNYNTLQTLRSCKSDGILVRAEEKGHTLHINFVKPIHTLIVGTTSSGKTTRFVEPTIQLMSMTASKPSFVIADPKGELFDYNSKKLLKEGYEVFTLDLRDPFASVQWNPLSYPYDLFTESYELEKEVKPHAPGDNPKNYNLVIQTPFDFSSTSWYEFKGVAYVDKAKLDTDIKVRSRILNDDAYNALNDIATSLAPIESAKDPSWEKTAQRLLHAIMLAMLEDTRNPDLGLTKEKYNFYNVYKIVNFSDSGRDPYKTLKEYLFNYRDKFSKVPALANTALNNADTTTKNYMGFATSMVSLFNDTAISFMTSRTEIDFVNIDEKPTAIFLKFPDEIRTRYPLLILFINQLYKRLTEKATAIGGKLKRNVYFLLDEFGNMPKFPDFGKSMALGRGRGVFFELVVQSYSQLYQVYGQEEGKTIKDNCPIQVYVASEDMTTNKEFSELLGKKTIVKNNENKSVGPDGKETKSYSETYSSRPIAYPEELMSFRDQGKIAIKTFTPNAALKTEIALSDKCKYYDRERVFGSYVPRRMFDEQAVYYDITERNRKLEALNRSDDDDDDDDDLF